MKPIIFNVDQAYEQLMEEEKVVTFRKDFPDDTEFWIRRSRTGEKKGEADLYKVVRASEANLSPFHNAQIEVGSGFPNAIEWQDKIREMYTGHVPSGWILYLDLRRDTR